MILITRVCMYAFFAPLALATMTPFSIHHSSKKRSPTTTLTSYSFGDNNNTYSKNRRQRNVVSARNKEILTSLRGGSDNNVGNNTNNYTPIMSGQQQAPPPPQQIQQQQGEFVDVLGGTNNDPYGYRETVEDRIDAWRKQQQYMHENQSAAEAASAVDEQGRFKLFTTVSKVSVSFFFFILMWRTVHHYELADATFGPSAGGRRTSSSIGGLKAFLVRTIVVTPLVILFLGEMMGAILGIGSGGSGGQSHSTKKRLKGVLNLHKGVELASMVYNIARLALFPSKYTIREVYIGRTISNFFFLMQCQLYTKLSWDDVSKSTNADGYMNESYYDDYTPEMENEYASSSSSSSWQSGNNDDGYATTSQQNDYYPQNQNGQNQQYYPQQ